ncbi:hypothetical protein OPS25_12495 [Alteromonas ponticola]|uniref:HTH araC/xylS-type domain-containing protein n=1 Tax=Alteromonas aquimaris TaxID=2998417 RepID=A0ABT3P9X0_9ALTE|nr:hypothetical protein [Alteromonas aquimaris]MCW8109320.1 hypothetical protein [Alteromonas aquimaris]
MMNTVLMLLAACYLVVVMLFWRNKAQLSKPVDYAIGLALWPLLLLSTVLSKEVDAVYLHIAAYICFGVIPLILALQYKVVTAQILQYPAKNNKIWFPALIVWVSFVSLFAVPPEMLPTLLQAPSAGQLLTNWPVYLIHLATGFAVLLLSVAASEQVQRYHHYLTDQVVDPPEHRIRKMQHGLAFVVASALLSVTLVVVNAFAILEIQQWSLLNSILFMVALLVLLTVVVLPHHSIPSPLDYNLLENGRKSKAVLQQTIEQTHQAIIEYKLYKKVGLTIAEVAELAKVDPTTLAKATREINQQKFRRFIYEYRLDYAKKVLLRSDTNIADVAKRLGLNSKIFLDEVLVEHLRNFKS